MPQQRGKGSSTGKKSAVSKTKAQASGPQFAEPQASPDPKKFYVQHASDKAAYAILDKEHLPPLPFPTAKDREPLLTLESVLGGAGAATISKIKNQNKQIVFHAVGDTGNTRSTEPQNTVADKMVSDYDDSEARNVPAFFYHLGDVVYSFGEAEYYYDQFYEPYRDYPGPIFAIPGNHDGMVAPGVQTPSLQAFLANFCTAGQAWHVTAEAGGLPRMAMVQPGVYFTLEAPFVRILGLYSNRLESPGIISSEGGKYNIGDAQLNYLRAALSRIKSEKFDGAILLAVHHPPYSSGGKHPGSPNMLKDIDAICGDVGVWPHAVLSGHAHNYQRFTRVLNLSASSQIQVPFVVGGNGGHAVNRLTNSGSPALRTPLRETAQEQKNDQVILENYDDQDYGYLRIVVNSAQLRIEYRSPIGWGANENT